MMNKPLSTSRLFLIGGGLLVLLMAQLSFSQAASESQSVEDYNWIHGAVDCLDNTGPELDVYRHDDSTYIVRQNKCQTYEAPFIYVLIGDSKVLVLDTGALASTEDRSFYELLNAHIDASQLEGKSWLILHTHGHGDHTKGDDSFLNREGVQLVSADANAIHDYFQFKDWPNNNQVVSLGEREITVIPTPGHQEEALSFYDPHTRWLMTGDTFYPGAIYVKHWQAYRASIERLARFSQSHSVEALMGAHIEMTTRAGEFYPIGTLFQPEERPLPLSVENLNVVNTTLRNTPQPQELVFDQLVIKPMNGLQKSLSNLVRFFNN
tara:strand:+ start:1024 stop:1989 length:966 start_codon:yes stop_codon:yes gene_type:complete